MNVPESPEVLAELARRVRAGLDEWWRTQDDEPLPPGWPGVWDEDSWRAGDR